MPVSYVALLPNIRLSERERERLDAYCAATERTLASAIRYMLKCHLDEWEASK